VEHGSGARGREGVRTVNRQLNHDDTKDTKGSERVVGGSVVVMLRMTKCCSKADATPLNY